jgi:hypothetical protein
MAFPDLSLIYKPLARSQTRTDATTDCYQPELIEIRSHTATRLRNRSGVGINKKKTSRPCSAAIRAEQCASDGSKGAGAADSDTVARPDLDDRRSLANPFCLAPRLGASVRSSWQEGIDFSWQVR